MANPHVRSYFDPPDPDASPLNLIQLFELATALIHSDIEGDEFLNVVMQVNEPGPEHRDTIWIVKDGVGRPIAAKIWWNGRWRRIYNGMIGEVRGFTGAPGLGPPPALFNANGRGNIGLEYDGWHICNGKDGVVDLSDKFVIGAHMNNSNSHTGYDNGWQTFVDGKSDLKTGGAKNQMIQMKNLPPLDNSIPNNPDTGQNETTGLWLHGKGWKSDPENAHDEAFPIVDINFGNMKNHAVKIVSYGADPNASPPIPQEELPILPPFYALAWITFVGYENT
jgi:hypothetical protein